MEMTKITVHVHRELLEQAKRYALENDTTLTQLITAYLERIVTESDPLADAPIIQRLSGSMSPDTTVEDYQRHLEEKCGRAG